MDPYALIFVTICSYLRTIRVYALIISYAARKAQMCWNNFTLVILLRYSGTILLSVFLMVFSFVFGLLAK